LARCTAPLTLPDCVVISGEIVCAVADEASKKSKKVGDNLNREFFMRTLFQGNISYT